MVENGEVTDQLEVLKSIPMDDSSEQEVESLWRQLMIHESFSSSELAEAKAKRIAAESTRQQAEIASVRNAKAMTEKMRVRAENAVAETNKLRDAASQDRDQAASELKQAAKAREESEAQAAHMMQDAESQAGARLEGAQAQADSVLEDAAKQAETVLGQAEERVRTMTAEAEEQAREIVEAARSAAQEETTELRRQSLREIRSVMVHIQEMSAAASEELETQRILTNVAQMQASARRVEEETADEDEDWVSALGLDADGSVAVPADPIAEDTPVDVAIEDAQESNRKKPRAKRSKTKKA